MVVFYRRKKRVERREKRIGNKGEARGEFGTRKR